VLEHTRETQEELLSESIKNCISTLFYFEKKTRECDANEDIDQLKDILREWIRQTVAFKLRTADVNDHRFIIYEAIRSRGIGSWGADLIQITDIK
jgi:hypothetical protein